MITEQLSVAIPTYGKSYFLFGVQFIIVAKASYKKYMISKISRFFHQLFDTHGRSMFFPFHLSVGCVIQK